VVVLVFGIYGWGLEPSVDYEAGHHGGPEDATYEGAAEPEEPEEVAPVG
jgi:hypothetical protein